MKNIAFLFTFFLINSIFGQQVHYGVIVDSQSLEPIPFVNLKFSSTKGTISNEQGKYRLFFNMTNDSSSVLVSHLGYHDLVLEQKEFSDSILLAPKIFKLEEVVIVDTEDLWNKVLTNFKKNFLLEEHCESFFQKQFLKENGDYVNYLEATGIIEKNILPENTKIYLQGVRKTDNLITPYINFIHQSIYKLLYRTTSIILNDGEITNYYWVDTNIIEATFEDYKTKKSYLLTIDITDYSVLKVVKNDLTNEMKNKFEWETIRDEGNKIEFEGFLQGELLEYDFKKNEGKYYLNRIHQKIKAVLISKDKSIKHEFVSEQLYLTKEVMTNCSKDKEMKFLRRSKALKDINMKDNQELWQGLDIILPLKEQHKIFTALGQTH